MSIQLPVRSTAPISSATVREDPSFVRRLGRQQIDAIRARKEAAKKIVGVVQNIQQEAEDSRVAQELADYYADQDEIMYKTLDQLSLSDDPANQAKSGKLAGKAFDATTEAAFKNNRLHGRSLNDIKLKSPDKRAGWVRAADLQGNKMIVSLEIAKLDKTRGTFVQQRNKKGFENYLKEAERRIPLDRREAELRQYDIDVVADEANQIINEARNVQGVALLEPGGRSDTAQFIASHLDTARQKVTSADISNDAKEDILKHIDSEETKLKREKNEAINTIGNQVLNDLSKKAEKGTLTQLELDGHEHWLTPANRSSLQSAINKTTAPNEIEKTKAYVNSLVLQAMYNKNPTAENQAAYLNSLISGRAHKLLPDDFSKNEIKRMLSPDTETGRAPAEVTDVVDSIEAMRTNAIALKKRDRKISQEDLAKIESEYNKRQLSYQENIRGVANPRERKKIGDEILADMAKEQAKAWYGKWYFRFGAIPTAIRTVGRIKGKTGTKKATTSPVKIKTQEDYDKLPLGAEYIHPETGQTMRKQ